MSMTPVKEERIIPQNLTASERASADCVFDEVGACEHEE